MDMKLIVPIPVKVIVAEASTLSATLPAPAVPSPRVRTAVVEANASVPEAWTVHERPTAVVAVGIVTTADAGITTSSAAVGWTPPTQAPLVFQLFDPVLAVIAIAGL